MMWRIATSPEYLMKNVENYSSPGELLNGVETCNHAGELKTYAENHGLLPSLSLMLRRQHC